MTLYIFTPDGTSGKSACSGQCLASWPALTSDAAPTLGTGLDASDFASITRTDDGAKQVTFYGMPLYTFSGDKAAGDTNGQGLNGKWYVVGADGKPIQASASSSY
jgi:predicted lipoprotein with Yx(FWY)xxD motif